MPVFKTFNFYLLMIIFLVSFFSFSPVLAYVMSSTNYRVQFDSINTGGGMGTSTAYKIEDTVGEISTGFSTSTSYNLYAGYQQMDQNVTLSLSVPSAVALSPSIGGISGGTADGQASILVSTNGSAGYSLYLNTNTDPALMSGSYSFANVLTPGNVPVFQWQIPATTTAFGFTPEGSDIAFKYKDNGVSCDQIAGSDTAYRCWDYFSTSLGLVGQSATANYPAVATTTLNIRAESGTQNLQPAGTYTSTITVTAHVN